jgi:hypothetical protein
VSSLHQSCFTRPSDWPLGKQSQDWGEMSRRDWAVGRGKKGGGHHRWGCRGGEGSSAPEGR